MDVSDDFSMVQKPDFLHEFVHFIMKEPYFTVTRIVQNVGTNNYVCLRCRRP